MSLRNYLVLVLSALMSICTAHIIDHHQQHHHHRIKRMIPSQESEMAKYCVSIRSRTPSKYFGDNHYCGGSIISPIFVLTSAHCTMDKSKIMHQPRMLVVVAGTPNRRKYIKNQSVHMPVKQFFVPKNFTILNTNNIALIRLAESLPSDNPHIGIISLPTGPPQYGEKHTMLGWGRVYRGGPLATQILSIEVALLDQKLCTSMLYSFQPEMMCAGKLPNALDDSHCASDKGSPLIRNGMLYGVASYRIGCFYAKLPSVYSDVWQHMDWINEVMERNASGLSKCIGNWGLVWDLALATCLCLRS